MFGNQFCTHVKGSIIARKKNYFLRNLKSFSSCWQKIRKSKFEWHFIQIYCFMRSLEVPILWASSSLKASSSANHINVIKNVMMELTPNLTSLYLTFHWPKCEGITSSRAYSNIKLVNSLHLFYWMISIEFIKSILLISKKNPFSKLIFGDMNSRVISQK